VRLIASIAIALLVGLLAARLSSAGEVNGSFSWLGFVGGVAIVVLATSIGRAFAPAAAAADSRISSPLLRWVLRCSLLSLLFAVASFVLLLYTPWQWPRYVAAVVVPVGAVSVFVGLGAAWFGGKNGA
jgi:MFS superfamily sulfate permease-like transporter